MLKGNGIMRVCFLVYATCIYTIDGTSGNVCNTDFCTWEHLGKACYETCVSVCKINTKKQHDHVWDWLRRNCSVSEWQNSTNSKYVYKWYAINDLGYTKYFLDHYYLYCWNWKLHDTFCYNCVWGNDYIHNQMNYTEWLANDMELAEFRLHQNNSVCSPRSFGACCEHKLPACDVSTADVIFVLDSSISQTKQQFEKQLQFVSDFIEEIKIGPDNVQIGLVTYSTSATAEIWPHDNYTKPQLKNELQTIPFKPGATYTNKGLDLALNMTSKTPRKAGMELETYVIILTDGMSTDRKATKVAADKLKASGVHIIAIGNQIGVGKQVSHKELQVIASPPDIYSSSYVFSVGTFEALNSLLQNLVSASCPTCTHKNNSDILLLFENDASIIDVKEFEMAISIATYIVEGMSSYGGSTGYRVGIEMSSNSTQTLPLGTSLTKTNLLTHLQTLALDDQCTDRTICQVKANETLILLNDIITSKFNSAFGGRQESRKFILMFTTGRYVISEKVNLPSQNVTLLVIGLGADVDMTGLLSLVPEPSNVYVTTDPDELSHLDGIQAKFSYVECKANN